MAYNVVNNRLHINVAGNKREVGQSALIYLLGGLT